MEDRKQGGLTGATGSLTPTDPDDEFVPAETREINDPHAAQRSAPGAHRRADDQGIAQLEHERSSAGPALGGDERHDPEEEHL